MTMCDHYEGMRENCSKKSFFHTLEGLQGLIFWLRGQHFEPIALRTLSHRLMHRTRNIEGRKAYFIGYMTNRLLLGIEPSRKRVLFIVKVSVTLSPCGCLIFLILFVILMEANHFEYFFWRVLVMLAVINGLEDKASWAATRKTIEITLGRSGSCGMIGWQNAVKIHRTAGVLKRTLPGIKTMLCCNTRSQWMKLKRSSSPRMWDVVRCWEQISARIDLAGALA